MPVDSRIEKLRRMRKQSQLGGGEERIRRQHAKGKLTAHERIQELLDPGSFRELDPFVTHRAVGFGMEERQILGDSVVTGWGTVDSRPVYVFAQDFTVFGGSFSEAQSEKVCKIMDLAMKNGAPIIGLNDSGGARIQEGVMSLAGYGYMFLRNVLASGVVPQISAILGPSAGGSVYSPAITDFTLMVKGTSHMFITGPDVIRTVTREEVTFEELGGAMAHNAKSGVAHFAAEDEQHCMALIRQLLSYVPQNNTEDPPFVPTADPVDRVEESLATVVPESPTQPYDVRQIIRSVVDDGRYLEVQELWATNMVVAFARLGGFSTGIVANQPASRAGVLDIDASIKAARFIRFCDAFNIPIVSFVDVPGFMPGVEQEHGGIIRNGAKLIWAYCEATVPKITIMTRKAYGGAYIVMSCKAMRGDVNYAWPSAEIAVMGPEGAVNIVFKKEISGAEDPAQKEAEMIEEYRRTFASPYRAAESGFIDEIILPEQTRPKLIRALESLKNKKDSMPPKKHDNLPL